MKTIEGVSTHTAGFLGATQNGPTTPEVVTSWLDYQNKFGTYISESFLPYAVNGFFANGGMRCYIGRTTKTSDYDAGLNAFKEIDEISILYIPDVSSNIVKAAIQHCEDLRNRFSIVDAEQSSDVNNLKPIDQHGNTRFAAFYYPWIKISDPATGGAKLVPPGGYVAGIFARNDSTHGVHKAPANQVVIGAIDLEVQINYAEQDILNARNVNVIRAFPGRGILVWGARALSAESDWKYVSVRRLLTYIQQSIAKGTRWVVSEPNDEPLWIEVSESISQFLTQCWMNGALMGRTSREAFFVKCDRTTMTQEDIDNGKLICLIGVAPIKPAEFVLFRIGQWSDGTHIED